MHLATLIESRVGMETVLHYTCRDRNLLGMQADLLGASALGVRDLLIITEEFASSQRPVGHMRFNPVARWKVIGLWVF